jgi:hypothetical protein
MGTFGSLDIRLSREILFDASALTLSFEVANLSGRSNPCCIEYEIGDEEDLGFLVLDRRDYLPTIPSIGINWRF